MLSQGLHGEQKRICREARRARAERKILLHSTPRYYFQHCIVRVSLLTECVYVAKYKNWVSRKRSMILVFSLTRFFELCVSVTLCASLLPFLTTQNEFSFSLSFILAFMSSSYAHFYILNFSRSTAYIRARVKTWFMLFCPCSHIIPSSQFWLNIFFLLTLFNNVCCIFIMPKMYVILHMILL